MKSLLISLVLLITVVSVIKADGCIPFNCTYNPGFNYHITPQLQDRIQCSSDHDKSACAGCCVSWALSLGITTERAAGFASITGCICCIIKDCPP